MIVIIFNDRLSHNLNTAFLRKLKKKSNIINVTLTLNAELF